MNRLKIKPLVFSTLTIGLLQVAPVLQAATSWSVLTQAIQIQLSNANNAVGNISLVQGSTAIIKLQDQSVTIGTTLAVRGKSLPGVPLSLQDNIARIRITQLNDNLARGTILNGSQSIPPRAPVFPLGHNQVYLYSNLAEPQRLKLYNDLTQALQYSKIPYAIKNWSQLAITDTPGIKPLIIIFEAKNNKAFCRLTDRVRNIFFQKSIALNFAPATTRRAGVDGSPATTSNYAPATSTAEYQSFTKAASAASSTKLAGKIKLMNPYKRLIFANYDKEPGPELVLLNQQWLEIYRLRNLKLTPVARYHLPEKDFIPLQLHAGDFNHNGLDELYLTLGRPSLIDDKEDTFLSSIILEKQRKTLKVVGEKIPYYFRVIEQRNGKRVLLVQKMGEFKQYQAPIRWGAFVDNKFMIRKEFHPGHNIFSLYDFNLNPFNKEHILVIDEQGNLAGFNAKNSEMVVSADTRYGIFDETPYKQKLKEIEYEGGFAVTRSAEM